MKIASAPPSSAFRDTTIVLSTTAVGLVASLGTQSALAWSLEPAGRGAFAVCATFGSVAPVVFGLATDRGAQYHLIAGDFPVGRALAVCFATVLAGAALAAAIGWLLIDSSFAFFAKAEQHSFRLALLLIPLVGLQTALGFLLAGAGRFAAMGALNLVSVVANLGATLLAVGPLGLGVDGALWALVAATGLTVLLQTRSLSRLGGRWEWPRVDDLRRVVSYGLRYYVARLGNVMNVQIGLIVMAWVGTPAEIGIFAAVSALIGRVMVVPDSIGTALQPRVGPAVQGQPDLVATASRLSFAAVGAALALLLATGGFVVPILLSEAFAGAVPLLWLMAPGLWIKSAAKPMSAYFIGVNRPGVVSLSTAIELLGNAAGIPILYRAVGLPGAAIATSCSCVLGSLVLVLAFRSVSGLGFGRTWRYRRADWEVFASRGRRVLGRSTRREGAGGPESRR